MRVADLRAAFGRTVGQAVGRARALVYRILDTVPPVRRAVDDLVRVEVVDRAMVIGAQALLALVPMLIVLAAFLPHDAIALAVDRFDSMLGISGAGHAAVRDGVSDVESPGVVDVATVRTTTGLIGILVTLFSASSFSRAVMRMYEKVWELPHLSGIHGRRRSLAWLLAWLVVTQSVSAVSLVDDAVHAPLLEPVWFLVRAVLTSLIWWWSMRVLLANRVAWRSLAFPAAVTGVSVALYTGGSTFVMPTYVAQSARQFGTLGLVLAVATWLVGFAGVLVVTATLGRVVVEDETIGAFVSRWVRRWQGIWRAAPRRGARAPRPPAG